MKRQINVKRLHRVHRHRPHYMPVYLRGFEQSSNYIHVRTLRYLDGDILLHCIACQFSFTSVQREYFQFPFTFTYFTNKFTSTADFSFYKLFRPTCTFSF